MGEHKWCLEHAERPVEITSANGVFVATEIRCHQCDEPWPCEVMRLRARIKELKSGRFIVRLKVGKEESSGG